MIPTDETCKALVSECPALNISSENGRVECTNNSFVGSKCKYEISELLLATSQPFLPIFVLWSSSTFFGATVLLYFLYLEDIN